MTMKDVVLSEQHRWTREVNSNTTLLDMVWRMNLLVTKLRDKHGYDSVETPRRYVYFQEKKFGAVFFGVEWTISVDTDRIDVEEGVPA